MAKVPKVFGKPLSAAIESARKRFGDTRKAYADRVGLTEAGLYKILEEGSANGDTLARLQESGGVLITRKIIASLERNATGKPATAA